MGVSSYGTPTLSELLSCSIHERVFRVLCTPSPCPSPPPGAGGSKCPFTSSCVPSPAPRPLALSPSGGEGLEMPIHERVFRVLCTPSPCPSPPPGARGSKCLPLPLPR